MSYRFFIYIFIFFFLRGQSQSAARQQMLDSLNVSRENERAAFNLYAKKFKAEVISGFYSTRSNTQPLYRPVNFTYNIYLPFQFDLNYVHLKAKDKLMKLNAVLVVHHSNYGNYALGMGLRTGFLLFPKTYFSYQGGLVWCEAVNRKAPDGINDMGFCLHHQFSFSYSLNKNFDVNLNLVHLSSGNLFGSVKNLQDVIGVGVGYQFISK